MKKNVRWHMRSEILLFKSVAGSSVTTIAGFLALCVMTFALGRDMGIVMAKGVVIGVICCITTLPAMILVFDGVIEKTKHKPLVKGFWFYHKALQSMASCFPGNAVSGCLRKQSYSDLLQY